MKRNLLVLSIAVAILVLSAAVFYVPRAIQNAAYGKVTHNSLPGFVQQSFHGYGIYVKSLNHRLDSHLIGESAVLKITQPTLKHYQGTSRNIDLVSTSEVMGSTYQRMKPAQITHDPNFTRSRGLWKDIPCYIVTIKDPKAGIILTQPLGSGAGNNRVTDVIDFVDAANGKILLEYVTSG